MSNKLTDFSKAIVALATALGKGSIAVIRVSGVHAIPLVKSIFQGADLTMAQANSIHFGRIVDHNREIDQVLVSLFKAPHSYTGEDYLEISCHANPFIVDEIIELLIKKGAAPAKNGEFTLRAFLNGKIDLSQAEAVANIIDAKSKKGMHNNLLILEGALGGKIKEIKKELIDIISYLELDLDFSEDEIEIISNQEVIKRLSLMITNIEKMGRSYNYGKLLDRGLNVAIIGKPNVGKSTLMNALLGEDRAITSPTPGTTRDIVSEHVMIDHLAIKLIDTAGLRKSSNKIELEGVKKAESQVSTSDLVLFVVDISEDCTEEDQALIKRMIASDKEKFIFIGNKIDLGENVAAKGKIKALKISFVLISAKEGTNLDRLKKMLKKVMAQECEKTGDEMVISSARHKDVLERTRASLLNAKYCLEKKKGFEFAALDVKEALNSLGELTGEIVTEDILNNIFSNFCIGK
jgi:tRNA modification GTPase